MIGEWNYNTTTHENIFYCTIPVYFLWMGEKKKDKLARLSNNCISQSRKRCIIDLLMMYRDR